MEGGRGQRRTAGDGLSDLRYELEVNAHGRVHVRREEGELPGGIVTLRRAREAIVAEDRERVERELALDRTGRRQATYWLAPPGAPPTLVVERAVGRRAAAGVVVSGAVTVIGGDDALASLERLAVGLELALYTEEYRPDGAIVTTFSGPGWRSILDRDPDEVEDVVGAFMATVDQADRGLVEDAKRSLARGRAVHVVVRAGSRTFEVHAVPRRRAAPHLVVDGFVRDVTGEAAAVARVQSLEGRLERLLGSLEEVPYTVRVQPDGLVVGFVGAVPGLAALVGAPRDETIGYLELISHVHPDDRVGLAFPPSAVAAGRWEREVRAVGDDDVTRWVWDRCVRRGVPDGQVELWDGVLVEVTHVRTAERQAAARARRLEASLAAADVAAVEVELSAGRPPRVVFASRSTAAVLGVDPPPTGDQLELDDLEAAIHPGDRRRFRANVGRLREGARLDAEFRLNARDGHVRRARARLTRADRPGADPVAAGVIAVLTPQEARDVAGSAVTLTPRQLEVLALIADGLGTAEIATRLVISPVTVRHHVSAILEALGARRRIEAVAVARRLGLV